MRNLLLIGRWHAITRDQEAALRRQLDAAGPGKLVFVITAADQAGTKRHPLTVEQRHQILQPLAERLGRPYAIHHADDIKDEARWVEHVTAVVNGPTQLDPANTLILSANPDVQARFEARGYPVLRPEFHGACPADVLGAIASGSRWQEIANDDTV